MASRGTAANPLSLVLQAIEEPLELLAYDTWNVITPDTPDGYPSGVGPEGFDALVNDICGPSALPQWRRLQDEVSVASVCIVMLLCSLLTLGDQSRHQMSFDDQIKRILPQNFSPSSLPLLLCV